MSNRSEVLSELEGMDEQMLDQVLGLIRLVKESRKLPSEEALLSESTLAKEWLLPEEEEAWATL